MVNGGLEKKVAAVDDVMGPLEAAELAAIDTLGKGKFLERYKGLNRRLAAVPVDARAGVRRLEYIEWVDELVTDAAAAGGAA